MKCKNRILFFVAAFILFSCNSNQEESKSLVKNNAKDSITTNVVDSPKTEMKDKNIIPSKANLMDSIAKIIYPFSIDDEIKFYAENGTIKKTGNNNFIGTFENEFIMMDTFYYKDIVKIRRIRSKTSCANSFVKYKNNKIITYDSMDVNCINKISYVGGRGMNDELPEYLQGK